MPDLDEVLTVIDAAPDWEQEIDMNCEVEEAILEPKGGMTCKNTRWEVVLTKVGRDGSEAEDDRAEALARLFVVVDRKMLREMVIALRQAKMALAGYDKRFADGRDPGVAGAILATDLHKALSP